MSDFTASDVLLKAASRIEEEGMWCQGQFFYMNTEQAMMLRTAEGQDSLLTSEWGGALHRAGLRVPECAQGALISAAVELGNDHLIGPALLRLNEFLGGSVTIFNDTRDRTAHEVAEAMRKAAL